MGPADFIFELIVTLAWELIRGLYREYSREEAKVAAKLAAEPVRLGLGFSGRLKTTL